MIRSFCSTRFAMFVCLALFQAALSCSSECSDAQEATSTPTTNQPRIVFLAGNPSHGYGSHEHAAGCRILAESIEKSTGGTVACEVYTGGWPEDDEVLNGASSIVMYADGGGGHPALGHLPRLKELMDRGVGFVCLHYAVEVPTDRGGPEFLEWLGGYFETHWSVNPHWEADFKTLPNHPVTQGVRPFKALDEWYFHMRFQPAMKGVTPILTAVPPLDTIRRPDGPHSGNPTVRQAVSNGEPQHTAWIYERPNGGRSFGFTGGHFHWNWGREEILKVVSNAIIWTAKVDVPQTGLPVKQPGVEQLETGQDYPQPGDYQREQIQREFKIMSRPNQQPTEKAPATPARKLAQTKVLTKQTPGHAEDLQANIEGVTELFLVVNDGGNGYSCDWADWIEPTLVGAGQPDLKLTTLNWTVSQTQWGQVNKGRNAGGGPLRVNGQEVADGIGTHANSAIGFKIPPGYQTLKVRCGLDNGGTDQGGGDQSSIQFLVYADAMPTSATLEGSPDRDPVNAVSGLEIHSGVAATLAAAEPTLKSLTNLDVDHRGRVWVCEVMNYRGHNGRRPEGDRILILEDENADGVMDTSKVFYQGRDIDSAMGICVLGNRVIVSASPNVWVFTDEDGDDIPDRQELLFTKTGQAQHDHSAHSFLFGPDGKLYWNFGNTGHTVHDRNGNLVVDLAGNTVQNHGKPYREGMVFRCDLDGSHFEVLGHNFRNNYEVTIDSFGTLWQSDNDDDGNRGVRINYVMEFGNFGYQDELTGAGWQAPRVNMEQNIPERHWHLNDPGVVPTMLLTGAGSPSGIMFYEGDLLPEVFRNQIIHCDPGPNVVRSYPTTKHGAGYQATMVALLEGVSDKWFRPADVCVAPDGSLFVTDWYDPGVGGHAMGDLDRGRLFRVAPPGAKYSIPKFDFTTPAAAVEALLNPNLSVRYLAWEAIQRFGAEAKAPLQKLVKDQRPQVRARALWAWGKLPGEATAAVAAAARDNDPDVRCVAVRLARQTKVPADQYFTSLVKDPAASVRRELAISLRFDSSQEMPQRWVELALQHDDQDRWYLEALGIGAELRWDDCFQAYLASIQGQQRQATFDLVWRARTALALPMVIDRLTARDAKSDQVMRLLRALDYYSAEQRVAVFNQVLERMVTRNAKLPQDDELLMYALTQVPTAQQWLEKHAELDANLRQSLAKADRESQVQFLRKVPLKDSENLLIPLATSTDTPGIAAAEMLLQRYPNGQWRKGLNDEQNIAAIGLVSTMAAGNPSVTQPFLEALLADEKLPPAVRVEAAKGLTRSDSGSLLLLKLAEAGQLYAEARLSVGSRLRGSQNDAVRQRASELFPAPKGRAAEPLPSLTELVERRGNVQQGEIIYRTTGTCANCHQVGGQGKNVGPELSQIGDKLAREALYVSILDPSAGISHSYESYAALLTSGQQVVGLLVSQTDSEIVLKDAEGIQRTLAREDIEEFKRLEKSIMPDNLHETLSTDDLVNLVEYLTTLKK
ncbi:MAG: NPCBM/NEW2 domain-containing protein [Planctomycetaceae bacterium]|nr:NPCBM/NEW2 domain-containing protein [Planctomycetaceae bacterium]